MTATSSAQLNALQDFFPSTLIEWRVGSTTRDGKKAQAVPYISARAVQQRLDDVMGAQNWKPAYKPSPLNQGLICELSLRVDGEWVAKEDGAQLDSFSDTESDSAGDSAGRNRAMSIKGAYSSALKRAAVTWGIGRYLYAYEAPWVEIDDRGRFVKPPRMPAAYLPSNDPAPSAVAPPVETSDSTAKAPSARPAQTPSTASAAARQLDKPARTSAPVAGDQGTVLPASPSATPQAAPPAANDTPAEAAAPSPANGSASIDESMLAPLDAATRNYVEQLQRYIAEGRNLNTVLTALTNGRAKERLSAAPDVLKVLTALTQARINQKAAA